MACLLPHTVNWVQVNGGAGFICGALMWRLLRNTGATVFNLEKICYASDLTNCSNNYGPWQFPEKLIPVVILKAVAGELFPLYGDGQNVRDWLYVEDHVEAVQVICALLDGLRPAGAPHRRLNAWAADCPGHDQRYAIGASKITRGFGWRQRHSFEQGLEAMLRWSLDHLESFRHLLRRSDYGGD